MIKTWQQRCEEHPAHEGIVSEAMIRARMQEEIDELRRAAQKALECLDYHWDNPDSELEDWPYVLEAKRALRGGGTLAQPEKTLNCVYKSTEKKC